MSRIGLMALVLVAMAGCAPEGAGVSGPYEPLHTGYGNRTENPIYHPGGEGLINASPGTQPQ